MPRLPEHFSLHIEGSISRIRSLSIIVPEQLPYLLKRLMAGQDVGDGALEHFGLRVLIEEDMDQGDEVLGQLPTG